MTTPSPLGCLFILIPQAERTLTPTLVDRLSRATSRSGERRVVTICSDPAEGFTSLIATRKRALGLDATLVGGRRRDEVRHYQHVLADELATRDPEVIEACVTFIERGQMGHGYGRARARMCRRLKHCPLTALQSNRLVTAVTQRLQAGDFDQQFLDHVRLVAQLDRARLLAVAAQCASSPRAHVQRVAAWVLRTRAT